MKTLQPSSGPQRLLTADDVAAALGVSRSTVWRMADGGDLHRLRIGPARRLVRFSAQEVEALATRALESAVIDDKPCECENEERGLFIWRDDPNWWSCVQCEGRVRLLTEAEKASTPSYAARS